MTAEGSGFLRIAHGQNVFLFPSDDLHENKTPRTVKSSFAGSQPNIN